MDGIAWFQLGDLFDWALALKLISLLDIKVCTNKVKNVIKTSLFLYKIIKSIQKDGENGAQLFYVYTKGSFN